MKKSIILGSGVLVVGTLSVAMPAMADSESVAVEEVVPAFAYEQTAADEWPGEVEPDRFEHIKQESLRFVHEDGRGKYWVARAGTSDICIIAQMIEDPEFVTSSCGPISHLYRYGAGIGMTKGGNESEGIEAYLLPADIAPTELGIPVRSASPEESGATIITVDDASAALARMSSASVERDSGVAFTFIPLDAGEPVVPNE